MATPSPYQFSQTQLMPIPPAEANGMMARYREVLDALRQQQGSEEGLKLLAQVTALTHLIGRKRSHALDPETVRMAEQDLRDAIEQGRKTGEWQLGKAAGATLSGILDAHAQQLRGVSRATLIETAHYLNRFEHQLLATSIPRPAPPSVPAAARKPAKPKLSAVEKLVRQAVPAVIHARKIQVTIVVDRERFPVDAIPPPGTPGVKNAQLPCVVRADGGLTLKTTIKGGTLQRFVQSIREHPQRGAALLAGRLSDDCTTMIDAGISLQIK